MNLYLFSTSNKNTHIMKVEFALAAILLSATVFAIPIEDDDEVEVDDDECDCSKYTWDFCQKLDKEFLSTKKTCRWKSKAAWSECSATCGAGVQTRPRKCVCSFGYGTAKCDGPLIEERPCPDLIDCPMAAPVTTEESCLGGRWIRNEKRTDRSSIILTVFT